MYSGSKVKQLLKTMHRHWSSQERQHGTSDRPASRLTSSSFPYVRKFSLYPFHTARQHLTSDGPGQDAGDRVHHLHPDLITHRRPQHHANRRVWFLHQPPLQQHLFVMSHHSSGTWHDQQQRRQLLRLRPEVIKVSPRTGKVCVLQVFEAQTGRIEEKGHDCDLSHNKNVGCV